MTFFESLFIMVNFVRWILVDRDVSCLTANGPAIWGGCVIRRQHRHESVPVGHKTVTVQGGYGVLFAVRVQISLSITRVAVQV